MRALLAALMLPAVLCAAESYRIAGTVVHAVSGRPMARIRVALGRDKVAVTDADGRFQFDGLAAGKYSLAADHPSGLRQKYGQPEGAPDIDTAIVTGPEMKTDGIVFRLRPPAWIHGRATDQSGEAAEGALVQLFRVAVVRGRRAGFYAGSVRANDIGVYRFGPLEAGTYYVLATGRPWYATRIRGNEGELSRMAYLPTFYPNGREARAAAPIRLRPGDAFAADFSLMAVPTAKLKVVSEQPGGQVDIKLEGPAGAAAWERVASIGGDGDISGIPPGRYTVRIAFSGGTYGEEAVTVGGAGPVEVKIAATAAAAVSGTLKIEGGGSFPAGAVVQLVNEAESRDLRRAVEADGRFRFENVLPSRYTVLASSADGRLRLTGGADGEIDVRGPMQLELAGIVAGAEVAGTVMRNGEAAAGVLVLLAPKRGAALVFLTDCDGSFSFTPVGAGEYTLIPIEDWVDVEYAKPEVLERYAAGGRAVEVRGGRQEVRLELK